MTFLWHEPVWEKKESKQKKEKKRKPNQPLGHFWASDAEELKHARDAQLWA